MAMMLNRVRLDNKLTVIADEVHVMGIGKGKPYSVASFLVKNGVGKTVDTIRCELHDKEHDIFWRRFISGISVYEMLAEKYDLPLKITADVEKEFTNHELLEFVEAPKNRLLNWFKSLFLSLFSKISWR